ncbi:MAG: ATP-binding protein [Candidatus Kapaibacteriota bacterium]|jgi:serine/threonine-protein kinase RsbW
MSENLKNNISSNTDLETQLNNKLSPIYSYSKTFKSFKGVIRDLEPDIFALREILNIDEDTFHNLVIIITEGFNNAVKHGNNYISDKDVNVDIFVYQQYKNGFLIEIEIHDQGDGYDIQQVVDPRLPENILKSGGRGVFLIKELSKFVDYQKVENGNKLVVQFEYFK